MPHEPKTYRFLPHFVAVNSQEEGYGRGCGIVYGWCMVDVGVWGVGVWGVGVWGMEVDVELDVWVMIEV